MSEGVSQGGRAAVVVPNGTLFGDSVCARIKEQLLTEFNLHTVVRLPNGVFAPYTSIPTNLLFFDRSGLTRHIGYYEVPLPEGRKNYTKTKPMQYEEFADCLAWYCKSVATQSTTPGRSWPGTCSSTTAPANSFPATSTSRTRTVPRPWNTSRRRSSSRIFY